MGSTGVSWGWASHSQVFGGAQALTSSSLALDSPARENADESSGGLDNQAKERDLGQRRRSCAAAKPEGVGHPEGIEREASRRTTAAAAAAATAGKRRRHLHPVSYTHLTLPTICSV